MSMNIQHVYYTGIGANNAHIHTPGEFLKIMHRHFWEDERANYDLREWADFIGASLVYVVT